MNSTVLQKPYMSTLPFVGILHGWQRQKEEVPTLREQIEQILHDEFTDE